MVDDEGAKKCKFTRRGKLTKYLSLNHYKTKVYNMLLMCFSLLKVAIYSISLNLKIKLTLTTTIDYECIIFFRHI